MTEELHVFLFSLLLFSCSFAQEDLPHEDDDNVNNVSYIILSPLLALFVMGFIGILFLMGCIFITLKELLRRQITTAMQEQSDNRASCVSTCGINGVEIEGFPMFLYSDVKGIQIGDDDQLSMECNICLNEFEDDEMLRLLPICGHMFHPDCINTWLASHVTCPVCRDILVVPCPGQDTNTAPVTVLIHSGHDPVPVSEPCSVISGQT